MEGRHGQVLMADANNLPSVNSLHNNHTRSHSPPCSKVRKPGLREVKSLA